MRHKTLMLLATAIIGVSCIKEDITSTIQSPLEAKLISDATKSSEEGALLVKVDKLSAEQLQKDNTDETVRAIFGNADIASVTYALGVPPKNARIAKKYGLDQWYRIEYDKSISNIEMANKIAPSPKVNLIQFNSYTIALPHETAVPYEQPIITRSNADADKSLPFNDPYLPSQWNLINDGSMAGSVAGADIGIKDAWSLTGGDASVIVAVFDDAINYIHSDLKDAVWINSAEKSGKSNADDDDNGYIDDKYGFNFVLCREENGKMKGDALNWTSGSGHGTHVAGTVGAVNGNGKGIASVAGGTGNNDGVRLLSCQIFNGNESATDAQRAAAYTYAADQGACIAQCSYGNTDIIKTDDIYINGSESIKGSPLEHSALLYFLDPENSNHESLEGNIAIYSSMNEGHPYSGYPGALPYCISVSAFGYDFTPSWYSNYGPGVKISAPGGEFSSEADAYKAILSTGVSNSQVGSPGYTDGNGKTDNDYVYMNGTSMACPHVSGVAALGIAYAKKLGKRLTRDEFISKLLTSVNNLDQYCTGTKTYKGQVIDLGKYKGKMGTGALDAWKFLMSIEGTPVIMMKPDVTRSIRISDYVGTNPVTLDPISQETIDALGLEGTPALNADGILELKCTKVGSGKISFSSNIGKDPETENGMSGMNYRYEIAVTCRNNIASNGGWL